MKMMIVMMMIMMIMMMLLGAGGVWAYDPPRVIGQLTGAAPDSQEFGNQFCWVGDQNGDGYDDLLVTHDPNRRQGHPNAVKLYFGDRQIDNDPDFVFRGAVGESFGTEALIGYAGKLDSSSANWIIIGALYWHNERLEESRIYLYRGGDWLDTVPDFTFRAPVDSLLAIRSSEQMYPADYNADGYEDLLIGIGGDSQEQPALLFIFNGGDVFDTIPDWTVALTFLRFEMLGSQWVSGFDLNGDEFDDFVLYTSREVILFLGGSPMDTIPYLTIDKTIFAPKHLVNFAMLGDVNGDGFDDWGCYWYEAGERLDRDGYYVFLGSAQPDMTPDFDLPGSREVWDVGDGKIAGGDFNGDHISDIVTTIPGAAMHYGEMQVFFGSRWFRNRAAIVCNISQTYDMYFGHELGAIGDFNGDGNTDFVGAWYPFYGAYNYGKLSILSGSADWRVSVPPEPLLPVKEFSFTLAPNPFNSSLTISYSIPSSSLSSLSLFNVNGRLVRRLSEGVQTAGEHSVTVEGLQSGLYLVALETAGGRAVRKVVCVR